jgi:hypothetical protein
VCTAWTSTDPRQGPAERIDSRSAGPSRELGTGASYAIYRVGSDGCGLAATVRDNGRRWQRWTDPTPPGGSAVYAVTGLDRTYREGAPAYTLVE